MCLLWFNYWNFSIPSGEALEGEEDFEEDDSEEDEEEEEEDEDEDYNPNANNQGAKKNNAAASQGQNPQGDCKQQWFWYGGHCCTNYLVDATMC